MTIHICPRCQKRYAAQSETVDYIHECDSGNATLDQEDVFVIGNWEDYTGNGTRPKQEVMLAGVSNEAGPGARAEGEDIDKLTNRGYVANTHRQRRHLQYIKDPMAPND
jgi:hypothetical protein